MAKKSRCCTFIRGVYISGMYDAIALTNISSNNCNFYDTHVFWHSTFASCFRKNSWWNGHQNRHYFFRFFLLIFHCFSFFVIKIISTAGFQLMYTSIFGIYSAYLFTRTGHFIAPFVAHAFCNHMGFPDVQELFNQPPSKKHILMGMYVIGFISWIILLPIVTDPQWYFNDIYYKHNS